MLSTFKNYFKRNIIKSPEICINKKSLLLLAFMNVLEDVLFWKNLWLPLIFIIYFHLTFFVLWYRQFNIFQLICGFFIVIVCIDAIETWLKYKHRTNCLKRLAQNDSNELSQSLLKVHNWVIQEKLKFFQLRERNPTKAFLLMEIILSMIFFIGNYINGYIFIYTICMSIICLNKLVPPFKKLYKKIQQTAESDIELEALIPDASTENLNLLSIEPEVRPFIDEKQSLDYWKPEDIPIEDGSDSSDNSSSLATNLSLEKLQNLDRDVEGTDSSEEEEYIPQGHQEKFKSSMEVQPVGSWSNSAYNVISALGGAMTNIVYSSNKEENTRKRVSSIDSSDGFEMVDKNDL